MEMDEGVIDSSLAMAPATHQQIDFNQEHPQDVGSDED